MAISLMKWVKALFVQGVSIFLQLIVATAKCTGNQIIDVISTSAGTNGVRLALHVSLLGMATYLYIMVLKKEIGREQESYNDNFISEESPKSVLNVGIWYNKSSTAVFQKCSDYYTVLFLSTTSCKVL